ELGAEAFRHRLESRPPLALAFAREAKRHPFRLAVADSSGARLDCLQTLTRSYLLGKALQGSAAPGEAVGILLPPSAGAALANAGISLWGRLPVNLNYTASRDVVSACAFKAGVRCVISSRRFLEKLGWQPLEKTVYIEDLAASIPKTEALATALAFLLLPSAI